MSQAEWEAYTRRLLRSLADDLGAFEQRVAEVRGQVLLDLDGAGVDHNQVKAVVGDVENLRDRLDELTHQLRAGLR